MAYNLASRLKTLKGKSPYDFIKAAWTTESDKTHIAVHSIANLLDNIDLVKFKISQKPNTTVYPGGKLRFILEEVKQRAG